MNGFWVQKGAKATMGWCEPNYIHSFYVAEWYNTISSLPIVFIALWGLYKLLKRQDFKVLPRFFIGFLGMALVGAGSAAFHGTLLKYPQASDELPMIYLGTTCLYMLIFRGVDGRHPEDKKRIIMVSLAMVLYLFFFTLAYFLFEQIFIFFITTYSLSVAYIVIRSGYIAYKKVKDSNLITLFWVAAGFYVGGVVFFWAPSQFLLPCDHWFQKIEPHSVFHTTSAIGTYTYLHFAVRDYKLSEKL